VALDRSDDRTARSRARWWLAWILIAVIVVGGAILTLRLGPRLTPVLDVLR
jgi:hypothetical protein